MVITAVPAIWNTESGIVTSEPRVWGDVRENGKDKLVRKFENCENGRNRLVPDPKNGQEDSYWGWSEAQEIEGASERCRVRSW